MVLGGRISFTHNLNKIIIVIIIIIPDPQVNNTSTSIWSLMFQKRSIMAVFVYSSAEGRGAHAPGPGGPRRFNCMCACQVKQMSINSFLITPRIETKLHGFCRQVITAIPAIAQEILLYSGKAEQRPKLRQSKPTDLLPRPQKNLFDFSVPFTSVRGMPSESRSIPGKRRIDRSACKRSSYKLEPTAISAFFLDWARRASRGLTVHCCDRSWPPHKCKGIACLASTSNYIASAFSCLSAIYRDRDLPRSTGSVYWNLRFEASEVMHCCMQFNTFTVNWTTDVSSYVMGPRLRSRPSAVHAERFSFQLFPEICGCFFIISHRKDFSKSSIWKRKKSEVTERLRSRADLNRRPFAQESSVYSPGLSCELMNTGGKKNRRNHFGDRHQLPVPALHLQAFAKHRRKAFVSRFSNRETVVSEIFLG